MIDIIVNKRYQCPICRAYFGDYLMPDGDKWQRELGNILPNKPLRAKVTDIKGAEKNRSITQMNLYWSACGFVANNIDDKNPKYRYWTNKEAVDFQIRVALDFRDHSMVAVKPNGEVIFKYQSIALRNLKHIEACCYFDRAFDLMATVLKYKSVEDFIVAAKENMLGVRFWRDKK